jgi:hypothetical protein
VGPEALFPWECKAPTREELPSLGYGAGAMAMELVRVAEHIHGHLGWLAAAALLHPAILLRNPQRKAHLSVALCTGFATLEGALGIWLYGPYRDRLKQHLFIEARWVGLMFERKEHLAFGAILLAWAGASAYAAASGARAPIKAPLRKFAFHAFVVSAALALMTASLGTLVASYKTF